jgi:uncharacterized protein YuzE
MPKNSIRFSYDELNDVLSVYHRDTSVSGSIKLGDFVLDLDKNRNVNGIELFNASDAFPKVMLKDISKAIITQKKRANYVLVGIFLVSNHKEKEVEVMLPSKAEMENPALA